MAHLGKVGRRREKRRGEQERVYVWGSAFIWVKGGGAQSFMGSFFTGEFKTKKQEFKVWEEKKLEA